MSEEDLVLRISGDSSSGQAAVQGQADAIDKATTSVDGHTEALRRVTEATQEHVDLLPNFISKYVEARTIYDLAKTAYEDYIELIKGSVEAYGEAEQAEVRLSAALKNTGAEEAAASYAAYAEQLTETTVISKTAGLEAAGTFTLIGKVGPESMNAAMQAAADFSAGTGRSMESATLAIAKASDGNVGQLKRFGIEIDAERAKTEGIGYVIDAVTQKFGGQAAALSGTLLGSWKQMGNQWELAEEQLGTKLAPAVITLEHALGAVIGIISASPEAFITLIAASTALAGSMAWMAATSVYGAQFSRLAGIIGGELTANVSVFSGVALTAEGSVLGLATAETTASEASVLATGSILGLSEASAVAAPAVAATATSVGLLGAALPVVVVAMAAWMVGKWLGDITGLTAAIQRWTSAGGDAALKAEEVGAKQDVVNRAIALGAPATIAYGDAVAYVNAAFARSQVVMPDAAQLLANWNAEVDKAYNKAQSMKVLIDAIKNQPGFVEGGSFDFAGEEAAAKKAKEAADAYKKSVQQLTDTLEGNNKKEQETVDALTRVAQDGLVLGSDSADRFSAAVKKLVSEGVQVPPLLLAMAASANAAQSNLDVSAAVAARSDEVYRNMMIHLTDLIPVQANWQALLPVGNAEITMLASSTNEFHDGITVAGDTISTVTIPVFTTLATGVLPQMSSAIKEAGKETATFSDLVMSSVGKLGTELARGLPQLFQELESGTSVLPSVEHLATSIGSTLGKDAGGTIAKVLSVSGPVGAAIGQAIGSLAGPIIDMIANIGGPSAAELAGRKVEASFESSFGGFQQMMTAVGSAYAATGRSAQEAQADVAALLAAEKAGGDAATAAANKIKQAFTDQQQDATDLTAAVQRYGFTIADLGPTMQKQQLDQQAEQLLNDWRLLVASGMDVSVVNTHMASTVQDYLTQAKATGQEVPMAMQPIIEKMIEQGDLTDANGNKITDMGQLGVSFSETMTEGFQSIVDKLDQLLTKIGMVPAAIAAIPTSVDVSANVSWNVPDLPRDDTSYAAEGGYVTPHGVQYLAGGGPVRNAMARATTGPRGTDTQLAWLTPGESVLNTDATAAVGLGTIGALNRGARNGTLKLGTGSSAARGAAVAAVGAGDGLVMQNSFDFSGSILKDRDSMQELADMMATILHDKVRAVSQLSLRSSR